MISLEELSIKNNEQMQKFCKEKISELGNRKHIHEVHFQDKAYYSDRDFLNYEIGKCKLEMEYYSYFLYLLQEEHKNFKVPKKFKVEQIKI